MKWKKRIVLILSSSAIALAAYPPLPLGFLACFFLLPFFYLLEAEQFKKGFRYAFAMGILTLGGVLYWIACNTGASTGESLGMYVLGVAYVACSWGVAGLGLSLVCQRFGRCGLWAAPVIFTASEYLISQGEIGVCWQSLALTQSYYLPLIQFISITGMFGITFWIVLMNVLIYFGASMVWSKNINKRSLGLIVAAMAFLIIAPLTFAMATTPKDYVDAKQFNVSIIQPNVEPTRKWIEREYAYLELMKLTRGVDENTDLIVWPETATPIRILRDKKRLEEIRGILKRKGATLVAGVRDDRLIDKKRRKYQGSNSIAVVRPDTPELQHFDKIHLVPFGEYVPKFLGPLKEMAMDIGAGKYLMGEDLTVLSAPIFEGHKKTDTVKLASAICVESIYPHMTRQFIQKGAQFLVVATNDAWYANTSNQAQHHRFSVLRAIENRITVLSAANTGISAVVDPHGRVTATIDRDTSGVVNGQVAILSQNSFYTNSHDWFSIGSLALSLLGIVYLIASSIWRRFRPR